MKRLISLNYSNWCNNYFSGIMTSITSGTVNTKDKCIMAASKIFTWLSLLTILALL